MTRRTGRMGSSADIAVGEPGVFDRLKVDGPNSSLHSDFIRSLLFLLMTLQAAAADPLAYIGTYTRTTSRGIYSVRIDPKTGALTVPVLAAETSSPSFLTLTPDRKILYAVSETNAMAVPFATDLEHGTLRALHTPQPSGGVAPCHLAVDPTQRTLLVANYHTGIVAAIPLLADATLGPPHVIPHSGHSVDPVRQTTPHVHSVTISPDGRFVIVCDLGLDRIFTYRLDAEHAQLTPAEPAYVTTAPGSGPRHFAFGADGKHAYVVTEMANSVTTFDYNPANGGLTPVQTLSTLPPDFKGSSSGAEIRVHPNGKFVYASNRGHDSIAVFAIEPATGRLTLVEITPCGGKNPRNFALSPNGKWLLCANQNSDSLTVLRVDDQSGKLTLTSAHASVPLPVCVLFAK
ncbi:MAG: 6-phosphogluconolactonase [Verrucomicrobia bacterium]|nr:6-phosphogluconolactonase [Verrucomicrobiota bacterium]